MSNNKSFKKLKDIIYDIADSEGNLKDAPTGLMKARNYSDDRIRVFGLLIRLMTQTEFTNKETKVYLLNRDITMGRVYKDLLASGYYGDNPKITEKTAINKIYYDQVKMDRVFGEDMLQNLETKSFSPEKYIALIHKHLMANGVNEDRKKLRLNLSDKVICTVIDDNSFMNFLQAVQYYAESRIKKVEDSLMTEQVGYFNYITITPEQYLSEKDRLNKRKLKTMLDQSYIPDNDEII